MTQPVRLNSVTGHGNGAGPFASGSFTSTTGSAIVVSIREAEGQGGTQAPTDNASPATTFTQIGTTQGSNGGGVQIRNYLGIVNTGRSGHVVSVGYSSGSGDPSFAVVEYGSVAASPLDVSAQGFDASSPYNSVASGTLAQADEVILHAVGCNNGGTVAYAWTSPFTKVSDEQDGNSYWTGGIGERIVSSTATQTPECTVTGGNQAAVHVFSLKGASTPSTFDVAESSAGIDSSNRTLAVPADRAESSAGTETANRTVAVAPGGVAETSAGTEAEDRTLAVGGAVAESSAGTEASDRTIAIAAAVSESAAGTTAQDATVAVGPLAVSESSAGATAQDYTFSNTFDVAESSTPSTAQDATVALTGTVAEASTPSTAQDRTIAVGPLAVNESSVGTTAQDFAPASFDVAEASTPSTAQDRTLAPLPAVAVAESSTPSTAQDRSVVPPAGLAQSGVRRWVVAYYEDYFAQKEREKKAEQPRKKTRAKSKSAKIIAPVQQMRQVEEHVLIVQRDREQAELDDEELLLLSAL